MPCPRAQRLSSAGSAPRLPRSPCRIASEWPGNSRRIPRCTNSISIPIRWNPAGSSSRSLARIKSRSRSGIISHFRKTDDTIHQALGIDLPAVHTTLEKIEKSAYRLIYLAGYPTPEGRRFAVFSSSPSLYPQRYAYELTFDALKVFATRAKADGYLPISLTASPVGETSCFSIILEKVPDRGCEMSFGLTKRLANEFDRRTKRGFSPIVLCGFNHATRSSITSAGFKAACRRACNRPPSAANNRAIGSVRRR